MLYQAASFQLPGTRSGSLQEGAHLLLQQRQCCATELKHLLGGRFVGLAIEMQEHEISFTYAAICKQSAFGLRNPNASTAVSLLHVPA
jgi:hypothetical protein